MAIQIGYKQGLQGRERMGFSQVNYAPKNCVDLIALDARAFVEMCRFGHYCSPIKKLGAELEVSGISHEGGPDFYAFKRIPQLSESFQGEFGSNNVEWNSPTIPFESRKPFTELLAHQVNALALMRENGINALCCGVLPSMRREFYGQYDDRLDLDQMAIALNPDKPRYKLLLDIWNRTYGSEKTIRFPGHSDIRIESCMALSIMSSFQIHISVQPEEAADALDIAAMLSAPAGAWCGSSPRFFGKTGSWEDYRPLFWREVFPDRTGSGPGWANSLEEMLSQIERYESFFGVENSRNPLELLENGETPDLGGLKTHMGCLWFDQRLKIHADALTIEERTKGSGTPLDNTAKAALWTGLMKYYRTQDVKQLRREFGDFSRVEKNTLLTSEKGLNASIKWLGKEVSVRDLILEELLPLAKQGHADLPSEEVDPYLSIVEKIARTGKTPAQWIRKRAGHLEDKGYSSYKVDTQLCREMFENQSQSVGDWN